MRNARHNSSGGRVWPLRLATCLALLIISGAGCRSTNPSPVLIEGTDVFFSTNAIGERVICLTEEAYIKIVGNKLDNP